MATKENMTDNSININTNVNAGNTTNNYFLYVFVFAALGVAIAYFNGFFDSEPQLEQQEHVVKAGEGRG